MAVPIRSVFLELAFEFFIGFISNKNDAYVHLNPVLKPIWSTSLSGNRSVPAKGRMSAKNGTQPDFAK
jgi:hypothetical protein